MTFKGPHHDPIPIFIFFFSSRHEKNLKEQQPSHSQKAAHLALCFGFGPLLTLMLCFIIESGGKTTKKSKIPAASVTSQRADFLEDTHLSQRSLRSKLKEFPL